MAVTPVWDVISGLFYLMGHRQAEGGAVTPNCQTALPPEQVEASSLHYSYETTMRVRYSDGPPPMPPVSNDVFYA